MTASPHGLPPDIAAAALAWLELREQGRFEGTREDEFLAWLDADPRHLEAFEEFDRVALGLDRLKARTPGRASPPDEPSAPREPRLVPRTHPAILSEPRFVQRTHPTILSEPRLARRTRPTLFPAIVAAAAAIALGFFLYPRTAPAAPLRSASTQAGEQKTLHLPDGSLVRLAPGTQVDIDYTPPARRLRLVRGSAHFAVAKDQARPFIVAAGGVSVRAVGTAFDVRLDSTAVEVNVTEGKVRVDDTASGVSLLPKDTPVFAGFAGPVLGAGQKIVIPTDQPAPVAARAVAALAPAGPAAAAQMLDFDGAPLAEVVAEFNRHNRHQLEIADERLRGRLFTGKFRADGYEGLTRLLETSFGIQVEEHDDKTLLREAPPR